MITTKKKRHLRRATVFRRLLCMALVTVSLCGMLTLGASAASPADASHVSRNAPPGAVPTSVHLNGRAVLEGDSVIWNSITYVPLRKFCNLFDQCEFAWDGKTNTATVTTSHGMTLIIQANALYIYANGHYFYTVGKVQNWGGSLYVPIRPLTRAFNADLEWNAGARRVELTSRSGSPKVQPANYRSDEVYWLSRIISAEAKGESLEGQIAVGNVVLNRVRHRDYPNTIYGVIFDRKHGTQFSPVSFGTIYQTPTSSAIRAAKMCLEGYTLSDEILFFMNPRSSTTNWIALNRPYAFTIGNHVFYK